MRCWRALRLCLWFNENSDFYYQYLHGDKETFHLAFRKLNQPFSLVDQPIHSLAGTMCQHDFEGHRLFQHRNTDKWNLFLRNQSVDDFWFEEECRGYLAQLQQIWDGRMGAHWPRSKTKSSTARRRQRTAAPILAGTESQLRRRVGRITIRPNNATHVLKQCPTKQTAVRRLRRQSRTTN